MRATDAETHADTLCRHCDEISFLSLFFTSQILPSLLYSCDKTSLWCQTTEQTFTSSSLYFLFPSSHISLSLSPPSLPPSLPLSFLFITHDYCICAIVVACRFKSPRMSRTKRGQEEEKHVSIDSSPRFKRGIASRAKKTFAKKGPALSRVFRRAINWSAPLCSFRCEKEWDIGCCWVSAVCSSIPFLPGVTRIDESWMAREGNDGLCRALGRTDIN